MHIAYLHQYFAPLDGIGGTRSYEMAKRLVKAGHQVTLITAGTAFPKHYNFSRWRTLLTIDGINLVVLSVPYSNQMSYPQRILAFLKFAVGAMLEATRARNVDLVFATSTPLTIALPAVFWKFVHRCPMVFEVRDLWPELPIAIGALKNPLSIRAAGWLERWAYRNAAQIVALSPGMADGIVKAGVERERITMIPNSCDVELFRVPRATGEAFVREYPHLGGGPLVVYTGTLGRINGVVYLVRLAAEMARIRPDVRFLIAGKGKEWLDVEEEARRLGVLDRNLWLIRPFSKQQMPRVLSAADLATSLFVDLPQMWNNSANKFFDALAAGCPVAINYQGWQADFLRQSGAGIIMPADDPSAGARMMREFLEDEPRLLAAHRAALAAGDNDFNRDRLASQLNLTLIKAVEG